MKNGSSCYPFMATIVAERMSGMGHSTSQLWELLLLARNPKIPIQMTCSECFSLLEYDADLLAAGVPVGKLRSSIRHHLSLCSECESQFGQWLERLESEKDSKA
ncbi:MAG: hypothetical protein U9N80_03135 [Chloroflexota bacterium]|nr:hypothetical protein [Chloroflexota bacterium]